MRKARVREEKDTNIKKSLGGEITLVKDCFGKETKARKIIPTEIKGNPAIVSIKIGSTVNLGNYESLRVDVGIDMPCFPNDIDTTFESITSKAIKLLDIEVKKYE